MTPGGLYAAYRGRRFRVISAAPGYVWLSVSPDAMRTLEGAGVLAREDAPPHGPSIKVVRSALDTLVKRSVWAQWRGAEISIEGVHGETVGFYSLGGPVWAAANGVEGDQHDGWWGEAPLAELTDVREEEIELPLRPDW